MEKEEKLKFKTGATSTKQPRLSLIPHKGLVNAAQRFELGIIKHPQGVYNALTSQEPLGDTEWLIERVSHCIEHCYCLIDTLRTEWISSKSEGDAGAIAWCGLVLGEAVNKNRVG